MERGDGFTSVDTCVMGYDGEYTRRLQGNLPGQAANPNHTANLIHGPSSHSEVYRPHAWLLFKARVCFPLSVWLTGGKELQNNPGAGAYKDYWLQKAYFEKEEVVDGLHTVKLRTEQALMEQPSTLASFRYLWLATDRNYLPVKTEAFNPRWSKTLPVEIGRTSDFREISPGVWLPFQRSLVIYCEDKLAENKQVVANKQEATLTQVDLNPHYDISLFRHIPFPDGTKVYEVKDDRIIGTYTQGEKFNTGWAARRAWVLIINVVLVALAAAGFFVWYRYRGRRKPA